MRNVGDGRHQRYAEKHPVQRVGERVAGFGQQCGRARQQAGSAFGDGQDAVGERRKRNRARRLASRCASDCGVGAPCERDQVDRRTSDQDRNRPIRLDQFSQLAQQVFYAFGCRFNLPQARLQLGRSRLAPFGSTAPQTWRSR